MTSETIVMLAAAIQAAAMQAGAVIPVGAVEGLIQPSAKWELQVEDTTCVLSRHYGAGASGMTLVVRKKPLSADYDLALFDSLKRKGGATDKSGQDIATIRLNPGDRAIRVGFDMWSATTSPDLRVTKMSITSADFEAITAAETVSIAIGSSSPVSLAMRAGPKAALALKSCNDDFLREWNIDPSEKDRVVKPATPQMPAFWISDNDYPAAAKGAQGVVFAVFKVDTNGRVADCRPVTSSGSPILDQTTCQVIQERARYNPALDKEGKPVPVHKSVTFAWRNQPGRSK